MPSHKQFRALHILPALLAFAQVVGCSKPGDSQTTDATSQPTEPMSSTDPSSGPDTSTPDSTTDTPTTEAPTTGAPTTDPTTDPTTEGAGSCAELCERTTACTDQLPLEQCLAGCASADGALLACLVACDQDECQALLSCTTQCAQPGDPDAEPYDDCSEACLPGVTVCLDSAFPGDPNEYTVCAPYCDEEGKCPAAESGDATPTCDTEVNPAVCYLSCAEQGQLCPDGMVCKAGVCTWVKG